jgi:hypothetical protein
VVFGAQRGGDGQIGRVAHKILHVLFLRVKQGANEVELGVG